MQGQSGQRGTRNTNYILLTYLLLILMPLTPGASCRPVDVALHAEAYITLPQQVLFPG